MKSKQKEMNNKKQVYTVIVPSNVNINSLTVKEKNGIRKISWKEGKKTVTYQVSPIFFFKSNRRNMQKKLNDITGVKTGTVKYKKQKVTKVAKKPVATGEIPHGLTRNEFRAYSKKQQDWIEYIKQEENRWNNSGSQQEKPSEKPKQQKLPKQQESQQELVSLIDSYLSECNREQLHSAMECLMKHIKADLEC